MRQVKPLLSLAAIGALCALLLAGTHSLTADAIRANRDAASWQLAFELAGGPFPTEGLSWQDDQLALPNGLRLRRASVPGYAGPIELLVALPPAAAGVLPVGVRVTKHQETPGIGDFIEVSRSSWILQFSNRPPAQVDAVTGATITSEAIRRGLSTLPQAPDSPALRDDAHNTASGLP